MRAAMPEMLAVKRSCLTPTTTLPIQPASRNRKLVLSLKITSTVWISTTCFDLVYRRPSMSKGRLSVDGGPPFARLWGMKLLLSGIEAGATILLAKFLEVQCVFTNSCLGSLIVLNETVEF